ncbi:MAG: hypothetical protein KC776_09475 [Myxococcales bacterium]|nr:hypothetical protein [Myxococcales bacterium]
MPANRRLIALDWGDFAVCRRVLAPGERMRVPGTAHVLEMDAAGALRLDGSAEVPEQVGALTVTTSDVVVGRFGSRQWLRDLAGASALFAYFGVLLSVALSGPSLGVGPELTVDRDARTQAALRKQAHAPRLSFEVSPDFHARLAPAAPPADTGGHMLLPERPAPERGERVVATRTSKPDRRRGGTGARALLERGPAGSPRAPKALGHWAQLSLHMRGREHLAKESRLTDAELLLYAIGMESRSYADRWGIDAEPPTGDVIVASFGERTYQGNDEWDTTGNMYGPEPADPRGTGLAVSGVGPGGSGTAPGAGMGAAGLLGHGAGHGQDQGRGAADASPFARAAALGSHAPSAPSLTYVATSPAAERTLQREARRLRACTRGSPLIDFTITPEGRAEDIAVTDATATATACLTRVVSSPHFAASLRAVRVAHRIRRTADALTGVARARTTSHINRFPRTTSPMNPHKFRPRSTSPCTPRRL